MPIQEERITQANQISVGNREVELANALLQQLESDGQTHHQTEHPPETVNNLNESLPPLSQAEFNKILDAAKRIHEENELKAVREEQARHNKSGERQAAALIAENDVVLPAAQARILELYQISLDTFELARARTKLGEDQNNFRSILAISLGLPATASREMIEAEQKMEKACNEALKEIQIVMSVLEQASKQGQFRHDIIDREGYLSLPEKENTRADVIEFEYSMNSSRPHISLHIGTDHLNYSVEYPGLTYLECLRDWLSGFSGDKNYGEKKFASFDIDFSDASEILKSESPAFARFLERLPEGVAVWGNVRTLLKDTKSDILSDSWQKGRIQLSGVNMYFKLKGYSEDSKS
jgi:hypothetical protein